jgi:Co/Zn/Cd efflux system component
VEFDLGQMQLNGDFLLWLMPAPLALYYLTIATKAQIVGINAVADKQIRRAVGALALVLTYCGIWLAFSNDSWTPIGLSALLHINNKVLGSLIAVASAMLVYASWKAPIDSIAPCVWAFGMSRDTAALEMSRKSAISARRRVRQPPKDT